MLVTIESRQALNRFMAGEHDELERRTKIAEVYRTCEVRLFELLE